MLYKAENESRTESIFQSIVQSVVQSTVQCLHQPVADCLSKHCQVIPHMLLLDFEFENVPGGRPGQQVELSEFIFTSTLLKRNILTIVLIILFCSNSQR